MTRYLVRRVLQAVIVIVIVTVIVFVLLHALPGGPARGVLGQQATPEQIAAFNRTQGLDQPVWTQYWHYLGRLLSGDLGTSYTLNAQVSDLLAARLPKTLVLTVVSTLLALVIAIPLGIWQAARRNSAFDYAATALAIVVYSTPVFFLGLILIMLFAQVIPLFPAQAPQGDSLGAILSEPRGLVLPIVTGALATIAAFSRYMRSATLDNLAEDYVRTARAKGTGERAVLFRHVTRNSLVPVITMLGYFVPVMFGGSLVVESMFNYPGVGFLFWNAAQTSDFPVLLGVVLVIAVATVVGSLLADIGQALLDPRVRSVAL
ncbi:ABC transporter permease [Phytoactinopolyspora mesophila]|uniref:ABC transporter permease subunit n=1 Tax=Phytoactinopolyspora mesophila TaxID=2650750 RepID=A0A7K3M0G4_9ACTN|nr:ABC transporter permease [Phytoactinopolyspora mesophila]NDL56786.1 ABC transporter permease subunit [Phytoactinopolyspora mesophila]